MVEPGSQGGAVNKTDDHVSIWLGVDKPVCLLVKTIRLLDVVEGVFLERRFHPMEDVEDMVFLWPPWSETRSEVKLPILL